MTRYTNEAHSDRQFWFLFYKEKESYTKKYIKWKSQGKLLLNGYPIEEVIPEIDEIRVEKRDRKDPKMIGGLPVVKVIDRVLTIDEMNEYLAKGYFVHTDRYKNKTYIAKEVWL